MRTKKLVAITTLGLSGAVTAGLIGTSTPAIAAYDPSNLAYVRKDDMAAVVMSVDDEDDDDTFDRALERDDTSRSKSTAGTGSSRSRADGTNSHYGNDNRESRDRDVSRGDKTRDWTYDGGDRTRDWSRNHTNDRSRNDTRNGKWA